jgi:hypothetical protein
VHQDIQDSEDEMREVTVEQALVRKVEVMGGIAAKHVSPGRAGDPDRLIAIPRLGGPCPCCGSRADIGLLELKRPGQRPRPLQVRQMQAWEAVGVPTGWADTEGAVLAWLQGLSRGLQ